MRATRWLLGLSTSFAVVACVASGCSSGSTAAPAIDSGAAQDVTTDVEVEAAVEAAVESAAPEAAVDAACVPDANLSSLTVPDASIGDSGVDVAACLSCFESSCPMIVATCNQSCACVSAVQTFATCIGTPGSSLLSCASGLMSIPGVGVTQLACALGCTTVCGVSLPTGDGGKGDGATGDGAAE
jgi:hypothetical protein